MNLPKLSRGVYVVDTLIEDMDDRILINTAEAQRWFGTTLLNREVYGGVYRYTIYWSRSSG